jgi:hypothetical protein
MPKKLFAWAAGVCALMLTSGVYQPADAKHAGSSGGSKGSFSMGHSYRLGAPYKSAYAKPAYAKTTHAFKHKHAFRHHKRILVEPLLHLRGGILNPDGSSLVCSSPIELLNRRRSRCDGLRRCTRALGRLLRRDVVPQG